MKILEFLHFLIHVHNFLCNLKIELRQAVSIVRGKHKSNFIPSYINIGMMIRRFSNFCHATYKTHRFGKIFKYECSANFLL